MYVLVQFSFKLSIMTALRGDLVSHRLMWSLFRMKPWVGERNEHCSLLAMMPYHNQGSYDCISINISHCFACR